ncbi:MAG: plastocyanin/azurin family copper-binding protein [Gemmatimonadota bacterium]
MKTIAAVAFTVVCAGAGLGCGSSSGDGDGAGNPTAPAGPRTTPITGAVGIFNFRYSPDAVNITVGGEVTWTNYGPSRHTTVSDAGLWDSGTLFPPGTALDLLGDVDPIAGESFTRIFTEPGIYPYHCAIHPHVRGTVYVALDPLPGGGAGKD